MRALSIAWKDIRHVYRNVAGLGHDAGGSAAAGLRPGGGLRLRGQLLHRGGAGPWWSTRTGAPGRVLPAAGATLTAVLDQPRTRRPPDRHQGRHARGGAGRGRQRRRRRGRHHPARTLGGADGPAARAPGGDLQGPDAHRRTGHRHVGGAVGGAVAGRGAGRGPDLRPAGHLSGRHRRRRAHRPGRRRRRGLRRSSAEPRHPSPWRSAPR